MYATHTLYALQYHGTDVALSQFLLHGLNIVEGQVGDVAVGIDGGNDFGVVCGFYGQRGAAVERLLERYHAGSSVGERGQLEGVLVGLGAAVNQEQGIVVVA